MAADNDKTQIGIRLPSEVVRLIDSLRANKTRAEYCRELIEKGLSVSANTESTIPDAIADTLHELRDELSQLRHSTVLAEGDLETTIAEIRNLRVDLATAITGVLTKIGQAVRQEDQRRFARAKAESFAKRVLLTKARSVEEQP